MNSPDARGSKNNPIVLISGGAAGVGRTIAVDGYTEGLANWLDK